MAGSVVEMPGVQFAGYPVLGASPTRWPLVKGTGAPVREIDFIPSDADEMLKGEARPFDLVIDAGPRLTVRNLIAVSRGLSADPNLARVRVTDRRYAWPYIHVGPRRYNMRRRVGNKRLENPQSVREIAQLVDDVKYHPASLDDGKAWTAVRILEDVLSIIVANEDVFGRGAGFSIDLADVNRLPIEGLVLDDAADTALARVLAFLPGAAVTVDADAKIRVYSELTGAEKGILENAGAESVARGHVEFIDRKRERPRQVEVLFERMIEARFDYDETGTVEQDGRWLENVLPIPDYSLDLGGRLGTVPQGTWVNVATAIDAWNRTTPIPGYPPVSLPFLRRAMVPYLDAWTGLGLAGKAQPDADWMARISALLAHYRQTYRVNRRWMDRIRGLGAYRVGLVDPTTGTYGPAVCYADYSYLASQRAGILIQRQGGEAPYAMNVARYPTDGRISATTVPAAADVRILDEDQGIVRFDFKPDLMRVYEAVLPSQLELYGDGTQPGRQAVHPGPSQSIAVPDATPIAFDAVKRGGKEVSLTAAYKASVILTALPAYPNTEAALHRVVVKPKDIAEALPPAFRAQLGSCFGPPLQIRVGADVETARVAWTDDSASIIERAFGLGEARSDLTQEIEKITLNSAPQIALGDTAASLNAIAQAVAASAYAAYADHYEGAKEVPLRTDLRLGGFLGSIAFSVEPDGRAVCTLEAAGPRRGFSMFSYLDHNTRRLVMRLARA